MMQSALGKIIEIASPSLGKSLPSILIATTTDQSMPRDLQQLLSCRNGFFAFESALHVFPNSTECEGYSINFWNTPSIWKTEYPSNLSDCLFFSEDIFGYQFGIKDGCIVKFDPETSGIEFFAADLEQWAQIILDDWEVETGYQIAHRWQVTHGSLKATERLVPIIPFVLGGPFGIENVRQSDAVAAMHDRAYIARQIHNAPDGTKVRLKPA